MATHYWISYRVHKDATYDDRYDALIEAIEEASLKEWKETTSFHLVSSTLTIDKLAQKLKAAINPDVDRIVVRSLNAKTARYVGKFEKLSDLKFFMDYATRV